MMSDNQKEPQYKLRWSEELRDKVVESAKQHNRSINAEICTRLEESFLHKSYSEKDLQVAVHGYLSGYYYGSAAAYKTRIDSFIAEHGEDPQSTNDKIFLEVLKILHSHYQKEVNERSYLEHLKNQEK